MTPRHRTPPSSPTQLYELPCRDCGDTVQVRLRTESGGALVPVFCNACLTARVRRVMGERRPKRRATPQRKTA